VVKKILSRRKCGLVVPVYLPIIIYGPSDEAVQKSIEEVRAEVSFFIIFFIIFIQIIIQYRE